MAIGMQAGQLFYRMTVRGAEATQQTLSHVGGGVKRLGATFQRLRATIVRTAAVMGTMFVGASVYALKRLVSFGSDIQEEASKFDAVFKGEAEVGRQWANSLGADIGRSTFEIQKFMAAMQDTFVPLGFARTKARELSQEIVKLSIDVASFQNASDADVLNAFQSALVGNHEAVRQFGIIITEAELKQELFRMGITKAMIQISAQEKVQARLNLIMRGTIDAQGDAKRTAGSFANQVKALRAEFEVAAAIVSKSLIPAVTSLIGILRFNTDVLTGFADALVSYFTVMDDLFLATERRARALTAALKDMGTATADRVKAGQQTDLVAYLVALKAEKQAVDEAKKALFEKALNRGKDFAARRMAEDVEKGGWTGIAARLLRFGYGADLEDQLANKGMRSSKLRKSFADPINALVEKGKLIDKTMARVRAEMKKQDEEANMRTFQDLTDKAKNGFRILMEQMSEHDRMRDQARRQEAQKVERAAKANAKTIGQFLFDPVQNRAIAINEMVAEMLATPLAKSSPELQQQIRDQQRRNLMGLQEEKQRAAPSFVGLTDAWRKVALQTAGPQTAEDKLVQYTLAELEAMRQIPPLLKDQTRTAMSVGDKIIDGMERAFGLVGSLAP